MVYFHNTKTLTESLPLPLSQQGFIWLDWAFLELAMWIKMTLNFSFSYFYILSTQIAGICYYALFCAV